MPLKAEVSILCNFDTFLHGKTWLSPQNFKDNLKSVTQESFKNNSEHFAVQKAESCTDTSAQEINLNCEEE